MHISDRIYKHPPNETIWHAKKSPYRRKLANGRIKIVYYFNLFRKIGSKKERLYIGKILEKALVKEKIIAFENGKKLPVPLKTDFSKFILVQVEDKTKPFKPRQPVNPANTSWYGRYLKNGPVVGIYLYRKIFRKTHRFYLGVDPDIITAIEKIRSYEKKIHLEKRYRTDFNDFNLKILTSFPT